MQSPEIALLFTLRRPRHPLQRAWEAHLATYPPGRVAVFVHADPDHATQSGQPINQDSRFYTGLLPNASLAPVERFGWSLVEARFRLLRHAYQSAPHSLRWFAFLSESCAPVVNGAHAYAFLDKMAGRSFIDTRAHAVSAAEVAHWPTRCPGCGALGILSDEARFSPGWIGLWHEHVKVLLTEERNLAPVFSALTGGNRPGPLLPFCVEYAHNTAFAV